jgi:hypothetical protein
MDGGACVAYLHFTFARVDKMRVGSTFQCNGVNFRVESCAPQGKNSCKTAVVGAKCDDFREGRCHPAVNADLNTPTYRYRYDIDKGLISVDFAPGEPGDAKVRLVGDRGLIL